MLTRVRVAIALAACVFAALGTGPAAKPGLASDQPDCTAPATTADMVVCADQAYQAADGDLNHVWRTMRDHLTKDEKSLLLTAQRAWLKYRDANCDFAASPFAGGTIQPVIRLACLETMTRARTEELRTMLEQN